MGLRSRSRYFSTFFINAHKDLLVEQHLLLEKVFRFKFIGLVVVAFITELDLLTGLVLQLWHG